MWRVFWVRLGAPYLCVWSGHLAAGRFLRTAGGPVAWPVLGTVGGCCGGVLRAVGPEGLLWSACSVGVRLVGWCIFCAQAGAYFRVRLGPGGVARFLCTALGLSCLL